MTPAPRGIVVRKAGLVADSGERRAKSERMFHLMDGFLKNDPFSLQKDILHHVEYTVARSRFSFDDFEAYQVMLVLFLLLFLGRVSVTWTFLSKFHHSITIGIQIYLFLG